MRERGINMLEKEFNFYLEHQDDLVKKYDGKVLVIVGDVVVGSYEDHEKAFFDSLSKYEPGTFLIQKCSPGTKDYTQTFHSRVSFA